MNIIKLLFQLFLLYMLYKLVFDFILPVYRTSKRMKADIARMQQKMQEQQRQESFNNNGAAKKFPKNVAPKDGNKDYIEFEEVK